MYIYIYMYTLYTTHYTIQLGIFHLKIDTMWAAFKTLWAVPKKQTGWLRAGFPNLYQYIG